MKILVIKGISQYNALNYSVEYIASYWKEIGMDVFVINPLDNKGIEKLQNILLEGIDFIFAFQGYGITLKTLNDEYLFQILNKKFIIFMGDHPIYHTERLELEWDNIVVMSSEKSHCDYIKKYYDGKIKAMPSSNLGLMKVKELKPYKERTIGVYFPGSYEKPENIWNVLQKEEPWLLLISKEMIMNLIEHTEWTIEEALEQYLESMGMHFDSYEFRILMMNKQTVDKYVRAYFRDKCIRTLCEAGVRISVCGKGWEQFHCNAMENIICLGEGDVPLEEGLEIINNSKIVFNIAPWFKNGCSGREGKVFGNGALYLTDHCSFLDENFVDGEDILFYSLNFIEKLPYIVKDILSDDAKAERIIHNASKKAEQLFSWEKLAREILAVSEQV